jgi:8-oxo-dGTP pyrophosphatase MutT (NUDIX family)
MTSGVVRAAGGLITRTGPDGEPEILIVHRPKYDDWTLPKGKAKRGETDEACALREVEEETSLRCELGREAAVSEYSDAEGRPKRVRYFAMTPRDDAQAAPANEVDAVRWLPFARAVEALTYGRDKVIVARLAEAEAG